VSGSAMNVGRFDPLARLIYVNALFIVGTLGTLITPEYSSRGPRFSGVKAN